MQSFKRANYAVRLNKSIERKLIFQALQALTDVFPLSRYKYLGMGSMWFMDFILAERVLKVRKLVSFELKREDAARARTNLPLSLITVKTGDAGRHLSTMPIDREKTICWLDFDNALDDDILDTARDTAARMRSGNILIVTVVATKPVTPTGGTREQWLRDRLGDAVPATLPPKYFDDDDLRKYPTHLAELLHETLRERVRLSGGKRVYKPLFAFVYRDGQRMLTVGGIIVNARDKARLDASAVNKQPFVGTAVTVLEAPLLTAREKAALDQLLPANRIAERRARRVGVRVPAPALAAYARWFREYPLFGEIEPR